MSHLPLTIKRPQNTPGNFTCVFNATSDKDEDGFRVTLLKGESVYLKSADAITAVDIANDGSNQYMVVVREGLFTIFMGNEVVYSDMSEDYFDATGISIDIITDGHLLIASEVCTNSTCSGWKSRDYTMLAIGLTAAVATVTGLGLIGWTLSTSKKLES
jgi:hypothetical protein